MCQAPENRADLDSMDTVIVDVKYLDMVMTRENAAP
jgi:hypothetical protein